MTEKYTLELIVSEPFFKQMAKLADRLMETVAETTLWTFLSNLTCHGIMSVLCYDDIVLIYRVMCF